jgi:2-dehydro-3-deoxyphosphooctonate aldolase (KDO 8-P synthase)
MKASSRKRRDVPPAVTIAPGVTIGGGRPLVFFMGPCAIEGLKPSLRAARFLRRAAEKAGVPLVFKSSYDKANRSSIKGFRGPGLDDGLAILRAVKEETGLPVISDVHDVSQVEPAAEVLDVLQIPAFLCRQTDLVLACGATGKTVNVKKGQWMAPEDMGNVRDKITSTGNRNVLLCERGTAFGYRNLVVDMRGLVIMRALGQPVVYDAGHSVQRPGGMGTSSGGDRGMIEYLARAAVAVGVDGIFLECHEDPDNALSDGPNSFRLRDVPRLIDNLLAIHALADRR